MYSRKPVKGENLIEEALYNLSTIESYQNVIITCLKNSGVALGGVKNILEDFPRDFEEGIEKLSDLLEAARLLEDWAIAHHQNIRQLGAILTQIENTQGSNLGGKK